MGEAATAAAWRGEGVGPGDARLRGADAAGEMDGEEARGWVLVRGEGAAACAGCTTMPAGASSSFDDSNHSARRSRILSASDATAALASIGAPNERAHQRDTLAADLEEDALVTHATA